MSADLPSQETEVALACLTVVMLLYAIVAIFVGLSCIFVHYFIWPRLYEMDLPYIGN